MFALALAVCCTSAPIDGSPLPDILPAPSTITENLHRLWPVELPEDNDLIPLSQRRVVHAGSGSEALEFVLPDARNIPHMGDRLRHKARLRSEVGSISGELTIRDPEWARDDPTGRGHAWYSDESVRVPLGESFFAYGYFEGEQESVYQRQPRVLGRYGLGIKVRPWLWDEVSFRAGPGLRYDDGNRTLTGAAERSEMFFEVATKLPVPGLGKLNVEYAGSALPALTASDRERLNQNLRFYVPFSDGLSQFQFGARWWTEDRTTLTPFVDRAQLYIGMQWRR